MKIISFSIYKDNPKYFNFYLRGLYFNVRFAKLLLPDWEVVINYNSDLIAEYIEYMDRLNVSVLNFENSVRCENMMRRFDPAYYVDCEKILCRDSDSCITWREAKEISKWEESGKDWHGINDNPAHSIPMMGGMIGFKTEALIKIYPTFESLTENWDLSQHGSDQQLIMNRIWPHAKKSFYHSNLTNREPQPQSNSLWESDLIQRYIGSAGIIEMEAVRFLERHDPNNSQWESFEKQFPKIFYWNE